MNDESVNFGSSEAGTMGGKARAKSLSAEQRSAIARAAVEARWKRAGRLKEVVRATHGSEDHPLRIADMEIPCYVLADGKRVLTQKGMMRAFGLQPSGGGGAESNRLARFGAGKALSGFVPEGVQTALKTPIEFELPNNGGRAYGYEATLLADLCEAVLAARRAHALMHQQQHVAVRCEILVQGFARVGIVALVDEATGYQDDRAKDALAKVLEAFIAKELQKWIKTFPTEFYKELFRLWSIPYGPTLKKPGFVGTLTNNIVYSRLAPGVLEELKRKNPRNEAGNRSHKHHQHLTRELGHPRLLEHLASVIVLMRVSKDKEHFMGLLDKALPKQIEMPLFDKPRDAAAVNQ